MTAGERAEQRTSIDVNYRLDDQYTLQAGRIYLTGSQALVRLPLMQRQRDVAAGLNTAGFISGYTGSPLGGYDTALKHALKHLQAHHIHFQPGINEDLAATAVWGSQQSGLMKGPKYDGVFGIWYGKGPGVDRAGDALKHGSYAGAAPHGGVLVLVGDDHGAKSSTTAHQSDQALIHYGMPYFNPATVQDYLDFGLYGFALSRYAGCWVGMKCVTDTVESSASVSVDPEQVQIQEPKDFERPPGGLHIGWGVLPLMQEARHYQYRIPAAQAFVRANGLDRLIVKSSARKLGIMTSGKAFLDVMQALDELGLDAQACERLGVSVRKIAMPWPLEPVNALAFARGHTELLVVEEKRSVMEEQLAKLLYNETQRPRLVGKLDESGAPLISAEGELNSTAIAIVIAKRVLALQPDAQLEQRLGELTGAGAAKGAPPSSLQRLPAFCAGCPHNTSTNVPDGSVAFGGIGCHGMALFLPERRTLSISQMGGEGAPWIGIAPFTETPHIFQNLGDGTYFHSGILAIRAAVTAGVNITYKILVNDAVAMTGGQQIEGQVRVDALSQQVHAEGVRRIVVVTNDPQQYPPDAQFAPDVSIRHRDDLDAVQRELREWRGVSVILYDQKCATELRRRRKRGKEPTPDQLTFINTDVCEGCGDCSVQSNCIAIEPVETKLGRKRQINQSACNKDFSCLKGYCPSFVTIRGGKPRKRGSVKASTGDQLSANIARLPTPEIAPTEHPYSVLVTGIGGSGVVTVGALIGVVAHLEGKACSVLDVAGLAQRNGPVTSHIRIADKPTDLHATRIAARGADLILGSDIVVTAGADAMSKIRGSHTRLVVNSHVAPTFAFATNPDMDFSATQMMSALQGAAGDAEVDFVAATELATALMASGVAPNLFLVGFALQRGFLPVSLAALERAIELNGAEVEMNKASLAWGRLAAHDLVIVETAARGVSAQAPAAIEPVEALAQIVAHRSKLLTSYQNAAYAERYRRLVSRVTDAEARVVGEPGAFAEAVAKYYYKLMAYKDEYEVARLYTDPSFRQKLEQAFEGDFKIEFNLAPPVLMGRDKRTGRYKKRAFGSWMLHGFKILAWLRFLRGTRADVFGWAKHRRIERALIAEYESTIETLLTALTPENHRIAVEIANLPELIRGYDTVKDVGIGRAKKQREKLLAEWAGGSTPAPQRASDMSSIGR